jgi:hypothetical protein
VGGQTRRLFKSTLAMVCVVNALSLRSGPALHIIIIIIVIIIIIISSSGLRLPHEQTSLKITQ